MAFKKLKEMITDEVDEDAYYSESKVTLPDGKFYTSPQSDK